MAPSKFGIFGGWRCRYLDFRPPEFLAFFLSSTHLHRNYDNEAPGNGYTARVENAEVEYSCMRLAVNDVVVHPNQGELISCDQAGRIKQWDLSENICTHELVGRLRHALSTPLSLTGPADSRW